MFAFVVYRGSLGRTSPFFPVVAGLVIGVSVNKLSGDDDYFVDHLWTWGLALIVGGLSLGGAVLKKVTTAAGESPGEEAYNVIPRQQSAAAVAIADPHRSPADDAKAADAAACSTRDEPDAPTEAPLENEEEEGHDGVGTTTSAWQARASLLHAFVTEPSWEDHFCFIPPNWFALGFVALGTLLMFLDLLNWLLYPIGGAFGATLLVGTCACCRFILFMASTHDSVSHDLELQSFSMSGQTEVPTATAINVAANADGSKGTESADIV